MNFLIAALVLVVVVVFVNLVIVPGAGPPKAPA